MGVYGHKKVSRCTHRPQDTPRIKQTRSGSYIRLQRSWSIPAPSASRLKRQCLSCVCASLTRVERVVGKWEEIA
ncbi:MAG: hypothetical protein BYD32DRAFT_409962 [Podila humilis]|nr:MAG: hypothetical protein BYD32DRAFT_409962 [Podila humilis]